MDFSPWDLAPQASQVLCASAGMLPGLGVRSCGDFQTQHSETVNTGHPKSFLSQRLKTREMQVKCLYSEDAVNTVLETGSIFSD